MLRVSVGAGVRCDERWDRYAGRYLVAWTALTTDLEDRVRDAPARRADRTTITLGTTFVGPRASSAPDIAPRHATARVALVAAAAALVVVGAAAIAALRGGAPEEEGATGAVPTSSPRPCPVLTPATSGFPPNRRSP